MCAPTDHGDQSLGQVGLAADPVALADHQHRDLRPVLCDEPASYPGVCYDDDQRGLRAAR